MKQTIRLTEQDLRNIIKETINELGESINLKDYELSFWDTSALDTNTCYFYFKQANNSYLLMVEYWADEDKIAPIAQFYTLSGDVIEDMERDLTPEEIAYFTDECRYHFLSDTNANLEEAVRRTIRKLLR